MLFEKRTSGKSLAISGAALSLASIGLFSYFLKDVSWQEPNPSNLVHLSLDQERMLWRVVSERDVKAIESNLPIEAHDSISREVLSGYKIKVSDPSLISLRECHAILREELKPSANRLSFDAFAVGTVSAFLRSRVRDREVEVENNEFITSLPRHISDHWTKRAKKEISPL